MLNIAVVRSETLSSKYESRFVVINEDTGKILDDAQGYGYKTPQKAHAAWAYKTRDKSKDAKRQPTASIFRNGSRSTATSVRLWIRMRAKLQKALGAKMPSSMRNS